MSTLFMTHFPLMIRRYLSPYNIHPLPLNFHMLSDHSVCILMFIYCDIHLSLLLLFVYTLFIIMCALRILAVVYQLYMFHMLSDRSVCILMFIYCGIHLALYSHE